MAKYTEDEKRLALTIFASQHGRTELVGRMLAEANLGHIKVKRVQEWAYRDRREAYEQIKQEWAAYVRSQQADTFRAVATLATEVSQEALTQLRDLLARGEVAPKDLPKAAKEAMWAAGVATDKGELLTGNPTSIVKTDVGDLKRELASVGVQVVIGGGGDNKSPVVNVAASPALPSPPES